jgi:hypothetical protein
MLLEEQDRCSDYKRFIPSYDKVKKQVAEAIENYKNNKKDEKELIDAFVELYWLDDEMYTTPTFDKEYYISPVLFKKEKERIKEIFYNLFREIKEGKDKHELKQKYEDIFEAHFWCDMSFKLSGPYCNRIHDWLKKGLNKEELEDLKKSNSNMLSLGIPHSSMVWYLNDILGFIEKI